MTRRTIAFECEGSMLAATLDHAEGAGGLLLVSGGNEVRSGAWAGQAQLAARLAAAGYPVLRFDRRGVGDSGGENRGFRSAKADIAAALGAFREACPRLARVTAFGNCDAASALMLFGAELKVDGLVLANPWVLDDAGDDAQAPTAIRHRYLKKLADPSEWGRLLSGGVNLRKLVAGLRRAVSPPPASSLVKQMRDGLAAFNGNVAILLASRDRTAALFASAWPIGDERVHSFPSASHSFSGEADREWLFERLVEALAKER
ncbi:MAG TPA: hydrolase 1, exosortase A system-associated [Novosphingobium sp.]|nr:hydrolase 1, exosortase A system-associated [Novosphingobium sp.]